MKADSSCGYEFASPIISGKNGIFCCKLVTNKVREIFPLSDCIDENCGIHVTVDISDFTKDEFKLLIVKYLQKQNEFYKQCAKWRQDNQYCIKNLKNKLAVIKETNYN